jgi:hypothetical protein
LIWSPLSPSLPFSPLPALKLSRTSLTPLEDVMSAATLDSPAPVAFFDSNAMSSIVVPVASVSMTKPLPALGTTFTTLLVL